MKLSPRWIAVGAAVVAATLTVSAATADEDDGPYEEIPGSSLVEPDEPIIEEPLAVAPQSVASSTASQLVTFTSLIEPGQHFETSATTGNILVVDDATGDAIGIVTEAGAVDEPGTVVDATLGESNGNLNVTIDPASVTSYPVLVEPFVSYPNGEIE